MPIDYDNLIAIGSMMGSGGLIIMDEDTCMVDIAKFFLEFTVDESCGKCTPCRIGTRRMLEILEKITKGQADDGRSGQAGRTVQPSEVQFSVRARTDGAQSGALYAAVFQR